MYKVLVVGPSWIGDTILAQPLFRLLHSRHPDLALDVLAPEWTVPLLRRMPEVRQAIVSPFTHGDLKIAERRRLGRALREERYDHAVVLPNTFKSALVPFFAGIPLRTGYRGEMRWGLLNDVRHVDERRLPSLAQRYAALAEESGDGASSLPGLSLTSDPESRAATLRKFRLTVEQPVAVLCPGAEYGPAKRWPVRHFAELAQRLAAQGLAVWLVGSQRDQPAGSEIARLSTAPVHDLCGATTLDEAVDLIASAALVVSNDSGLMHVAAALGKPLIALYGSSSPAYTPPLSSNARILKLDLPCSPCFERACPLGHFNCMNQLAPAQVFAAIEFDKIRQTMP